MPTPAPTQLISAYINIRDKRADLAKQDTALEGQQNIIKGYLLDLCKGTDASSLKTEVGTIIRSVKTRYWTNDWQSMYKFIKDNDAFDLMEQRIAQGRLKEFLANNPGKLPPGLNSESEYTISVRRGK